MKTRRVERVERRLSFAERESKLVRFLAPQRFRRAESTCIVLAVSYYPIQPYPRISPESPPPPAPPRTLLLSFSSSDHVKFPSGPHQRQREPKCRSERPLTIDQLSAHHASRCRNTRSTSPTCSSLSSACGAESGERVGLTVERTGREVRTSRRDSYTELERVDFGREDEDEFACNGARLFRPVWLDWESTREHCYTHPALHCPALTTSPPSLPPSIEAVHPLSLSHARTTLTPARKRWPSPPTLLQHPPSPGSNSSSPSSSSPRSCTSRGWWSSGSRRRCSAFSSVAWDCSPLTGTDSAGERAGPPNKRWRNRAFQSRKTGAFSPAPPFFARRSRKLMRMS